MPTMAEQTRINRSHAISATSKTCIDKIKKIQSFGSLKIKITEEIYDKTIFIDFPILKFCFTG